MVEAGIVAPIFAIIYLSSVYVGGTYEAKYRSVNKSRGDGFGYASRNCEGNGQKDDSGIGNFDQTDGATAANGSGKGPDVPSDISGALFMAHIKSEEKFNFPFANVPFSGDPQVKVVHSDSFCMCNEKKHGMNVFTYLGQFIGQLSIP